MSDYNLIKLSGLTTSKVASQITTADIAAGETVAGVVYKTTYAELISKFGDTISIGASQVTDFDTEVSNNTSVTANTAKISCTTANVDAAGAVMNTDTSTAAMSFVIDEDNMSSDSATKVPTQQSVKAYADGLLAANDAMIYKGVIACSTNPNYPAADA